MATHHTINSYARNDSYVIPGVYDIEQDDVSWIMVASIIIFSMQTGFGLLESGIVSRKNEVNIMMKNIVDVVLGGFTYWLFGYGLSYGRSNYTTPFIAFGDFMVDPEVNNPLMGQIFTSFFFQLSFATTATTILSGTVAERINFHAYCLFSLINTVVYCIPAGWVWGEHGFLKTMGVVDIAGSGPVHLLGGASALAAGIMLGPRVNRYDKEANDPPPMGNPINACVGLFFLWWGWLAFNSGSTYGLSDTKWEYAARSAFMTILASFGGGSYALIHSLIKQKGKLDPSDLINGILGSLVGITAGCFLFRAWESILVGVIGSILTLTSLPLFDKLRIDDPVGAIAVHGVSGIWGVLAVGLFADDTHLGSTSGRLGVLKGGGWYLLGVQSLAVICIVFWATSSTFLLLWIVNKITPLRMDPKDELLGADYTEHNIMSSPVAKETTTNSSSSNGRNDESQISQRFRLPQSDDRRLTGVYRNYFNDELSSERSKAPMRENPAFINDEGV
ncbi:CLUMA_CG000499, isoform A [Clunio marinus]|uniref:Ammonium transporter n=1 Tax=Clunio marinus TaxID=568069 RepID=A0A1J1HFB9_9DIPT|nr:CLUMA_CG000499, isoform A [Clunio marinus]